MRGKEPDSSERLINFVIGGGNTSRHSVKSLVGMGTREQVVFVDDLIVHEPRFQKEDEIQKKRGHQVQGGIR